VLHSKRTERVFKTAWFAKASKKAHISDEELCAAIAQVMLGQADDLGGSVYKKRLGKNLYRSIIVTRSKEFWVYEYLFAKSKRANIDDEELTEFRRIAKNYATLTSDELNGLLEKRYLWEICNAKERQIQE
jgi:hypothetical protein